MGKSEWLFYVVLAGLSWGTYVPLIFYGGNELGKPPGNRLMAILCVGVAYFLIAILLPTGILWYRGKVPDWTTTARSFSILHAGTLTEVCS